MIHFWKTGSMYGQSLRRSGHGLSIYLIQDLPSIVSLLSASSPRFLIHPHSQLNPTFTPTKPNLAHIMTMADGRLFNSSKVSFMSYLFKAQETIYKGPIRILWDNILLVWFSVNGFKHSFKSPRLDDDTQADITIIEVRRVGDATGPPRKPEDFQEIPFSWSNAGLGNTTRRRAGPMLSTGFAAA
jgi:hypothetical protein